MRAFAHVRTKVPLSFLTGFVLTLQSPFLGFRRVVVYASRFVEAISLGVFPSLQVTPSSTGSESPRTGSEAKSPGTPFRPVCPVQISRLLHHFFSMTSKGLSELEFGFCSFTSHSFFPHTSMNSRPLNYSQ